MAVPTVLPTEATPLDFGHKRKHGEVIDLTEDDDVATANQQATAKHPDNLQETESQQTYTTASENGTHGLTKERKSALRALLRDVGPEKFIEDTLGNQSMSMRQLGLVFNLNPAWLAGDDDTYFTLLGLAITRAYYKRRKLEQYNSIDDAAQLLRRSRNIMVITGAGISTSLGIPDFRSKGTGFYDKVREKGFEDAEEVFEINNFDYDPGKFFSLARDILPNLQRVSPTHAFIRLLQDKDRLQTNYTQNIDNLEALAGIDENRLIQCHGSFATATCRKCKFKVKGTEIFDDIRAERIARCKRCAQEIERKKDAPPPLKRNKSASRNRYSDDDEDEDDDIPEPGVMKPDITFFGEALPTTFFDRFTQRDAQQTDLVIVIGTSLKVAPVSEMPNYLPHPIPHIYISKEPIAHVNFDIQLLGNCDDVVFELARRAGWDLKHEMIPVGLTVDVSPVADTSHYWRLTRREREIAATDSEASDDDDDDDDDDEDDERTEVPLRQGPPNVDIPGIPVPFEEEV
ncbi:hypothetical protein M409DRAFT_17505 [Zasmidium cellare ATCC 36951]|uniref:Deacetylase sirtuin-type domain-containing protein n=1 Tax=Zasmidium cellare ATCC 36951 TaxID=1080233 RepID=A0A6A6CYV8_ZASCE|nr:uncharacterized protein M409DRAFT_17505 [Zasmidium cellare ATCC 36951]KAF2172271.1 hypothetical protein M409DRAFT_17505 [Zasmidium cellare ATCC 36951]